MTYSSSDWIKAVTNLTKLTSRGLITWNPNNPPYDFWVPGHYSVDRSYTARYKDRIYVLYAIRTTEINQYEELYFKFDNYIDVCDKNDMARLARGKSLRPVGDLISLIENKRSFEAGALDDLLDNPTEKSDSNSDA